MAHPDPFLWEAGTDSQPHGHRKYQSQDNEIGTGN
jgi:hypothetical protein